MRNESWLCLALLGFSCSWPALPKAASPDLALVRVPQKEQPPLELELRHLETPMGGGQPRPITDAIVSIDHKEVFAVHLPAGQVTALSAASGLYLVRIDFTVHPPERPKRIKEVKLEISLRDPKAAGLDVFPKRLTDSREVPRSLQVKTNQLQPRRDDTGQIAAEGLEPVVIGFQRGKGEAYWILQGPGGAPLKPGPRRVFFLVRTPAANRVLRGVVRCSGNAETWLAGQWWSYPKPEVDWKLLEVDLLDPDR
jgi:hypothetical protein